MMEGGFTIEFWYWWVAAALLIALEVAIPGVFFLWLGIAAAVVGGIAFLIPSLGWAGQTLIFAVLAFAAIVVARQIVKRRPPDSDEPSLNRRGEQYVGRVLTLSAAIENGRGRAAIGDTAWTVEGDDMPAGARVRVVGIDGIVLKVEADG